MSAQRSPLQLALGAQVRAVRVRRGLSQQALAAASGLQRSYVGGIERGERNPSLRNIGRLADALGVPAAELLREPEDEAQSGAALFRSPRSIAPT